MLKLSQQWEERVVRVNSDSQRNEMRVWDPGMNRGPLENGTEDDYIEPSILTELALLNFLKSSQLEKGNCHHTIRGFSYS